MRDDNTGQGEGKCRVLLRRQADVLFLLDTLPESNESSCAFGEKKK